MVGICVLICKELDMVKVFLKYSDINKVSRLLHLRVTDTGLIHIIHFPDHSHLDYEFIEVEGGIEITTTDSDLQLWLTSVIDSKGSINVN